MSERIDVSTLQTRRAGGTDMLIVDIRSPEEFEAGHVDGAVNIPSGELSHRADELRHARLVVTVCTKGGERSQSAARELRAGPG